MAKVFVRSAVGLALSVLIAFGISAPAWAHVTVHPNTLPAGSSDIELTFRVPNERDNSNTVTVQVFFPTTLPLLTVNVLPVSGWTATVHTQSLAKPIHTDDGPVSQIVSDVTWKATAGGISPGQYEDFAVAAGLVPDKPAQLVFKALQTYASGEVVRWIEASVAGQPQPDFPAPVLSLTSKGASTVPTANVAAARSGASGSSTTSDALAIAALVLGAANSIGLAFFVSRNRRRRSTE